EKPLEARCKFIGRVIQTGWRCVSVSRLARIGLQPLKRPATGRVSDGPQANSEAWAGGRVATVKFAVQDLPGDVQPRDAIGRQSGVLGFQQVQQFAFVLTQHVGEGRWTTLGRDHGQLVASGFEPQAKADSAFIKFDRRVHSNNSCGSFSPFSVNPSFGSGTREQPSSLLGGVEFSRWNRVTACSISKGGFLSISTGFVPLFHFAGAQRDGVYRFQASSKSCRSYPWAVSVGDVRTLRLCTPKAF